MRTESLVSIAAGGIAFATPEHRRDSPPTDASIPFRLYEDFDAAQSGLKVLLRLKSVDALEPGKTPVIYNGVQVGTLKSMDMGKDFSQATAELTMDPRTEELLVEGTEFWTVKPSISLAGITGLEALVKGNYIEVRFSKEGAPTREFVVREKAPPLKENAPGLHLNLTSERVGSLQAGSPVLYRQMRVGTVQSTQLSSDKRSVTFTVHIPPEFSNLVNDSTRFWNASGVTLKGGLSGVEVKSESLESLIMGGISFDTPDLNKPRRKSEFVLYDSEDKASARGVMLDIRVPSADGLNVGTPVRFIFREGANPYEGKKNPLSDRQIQRAVRRAGVGLIRLGSFIGHGSGEVFLGFTTANRIPHEGGEDVIPLRALNENRMDDLFRAVAEATEEAVLNSMAAAGSVTGYRGHVRESLADLLRGGQ